MEDARHLHIVKRGDSVLHKQAMRTVARRPYVPVIYDRRERERRLIPIPPGVERRRGAWRVWLWLDTELRDPA